MEESLKLNSKLKYISPIVKIKWNIEQYQLIPKKQERKKKVTRKDETKQKPIVSGRFKLNHIDNYIKYKWSKDSN